MDGSGTNVPRPRRVSREGVRVAAAASGQRDGAAGRADGAVWERVDRADRGGGGAYIENDISSPSHL